MSDEITNDGNIGEEEADAVEQERSAGCLQLSALCCCLPRRRRRLPGRRPKDRKKKTDKQKNAGDASSSDTMSEERKQNVGQDYRGMASAGDSGSVQTEGIKPALTVCIQINDRTADLFIPVTLGEICLEGRGEVNTEKTSGNTLFTEGKMQQQMEKPESVFFLEPEKESVEGAVSEGVPSEEGKGHVVIPAKENIQCGRSELLGALLQGPTSKKEPQGAENVIFKLEDLSSEEKEEDQLEVTFQELSQSRQPAFSSASAANGNKLDEEQIATTYSEGENFSQDQKNVLSNVPLGLHELLLELTCTVDRQVAQHQMMPVDKGDTQNKDEEYQDISSEKMKQTIEPECPDVFSSICGNNEWKEQQNLEASSNNVEQCYLNVLEKKDQPPVTPTGPNFSLQATTQEKTQEEVQTLKSASSDVCLSKGSGHQGRPHQKYEEVAAPNYMPVLPTDETCIMDLQHLTHGTFLPEDVAVPITDQKQTEVQQQILLEQTSRSCYSETDEQETQSPIVTEDISIHLDSISHEKEQPRKLERGDSEPEGVHDKKDQDHQRTIHLEMQPPSVFAEPLKAIPGEDQCVRKEDVNPGQADIHLLDVVPTETDDQSKMHIFASSKEKGTAQQQKKQQPNMSTQEGGIKEEKQPESRLIQKNTTLPYEEQQKREQTNLDVTGEAHQKEKQALSDVAFLYNTQGEEEEEGHM